MSDRDDGERDAHAAGANPKLVSSTSGTLVTETLPEYDGGRQVTVYIPPRPTDAVVFAGDGQAFLRWGRLLEARELSSTMIVGVHGLTEEKARLCEYSPGFDAGRFSAHERFFVDDVPRWVRARFGVALPAARTAVFGYSAGGELALALGLRHCDVFGAVCAGSPGGGFQPTGPMPTSLPRVYLFAGTQEPFFRHNAVRWLNALHEAGADVVMSERDVPHGAASWRGQFPQMLTWAFGARDENAGESPSP